MFDSSFINFGVVKIDNGVLKVYDSPYHFLDIHGPNGAVSARWAGDGIIVNYSDGTIRRWDSPYHYDIIY